MKHHYLAQYIASAQHKIAINVIGCGGTGSHVLTNLAAMNRAFIGLRRQPLHVTAYDDDIVEEHNVGRQMFSPSDIGQNKATVLIERTNRYFGSDWEAIPVRYGKGMNWSRSNGCNIIITCVDSARSRKNISEYFSRRENLRTYSNEDTLYYWLDIGNPMRTGQIILGTVLPIKQPTKNGISELPRWDQEYKGVKDKKDEPSCSLAESLGRQDLFINKVMATYATTMLWHLMKEFRIHYRGVYVNIAEMKTLPILL